MTFRQVPASEGDMVHVSIETVTPNSPAAQADLQRGDRLIAIGGVKVTSSVQVPKLLKAAGDRVLVLYERPVRHQNVAPESYASDEPPPAYEEEPAPICALTELHEPRDPREMDSEFEELTVEARSPPPASAQTDLRDECLLSASPKRSAVSLASKPLGSISPILSRKLQLVGLQAPLRPQPSPKHSPHRSSCELSAEGVPRPSLPPVPPPVPPRPHIRLTSASSETSLTDTAEGPGTLASSSSSNALSSLERSPEKTASGGDAGEEVVAARAEHAKEKLSESSCSTSLDEHAHWESAETLYKSQNARWSKASALFDVEAHHKYLNVALWCKDPFKLGALLCLGHASLPLEQVALECLATASSEFQSTFRLRAPEPRANVSRTALRSLSAHKGFNEKLCYGDVTLNLCYGSDTEAELGTTEREREDDCRERERETPALTQRDELLYGALQMVEVRHNFQDTQFQNPTWCEYCKKKVWTKAASQCMVCAYVCHKKCQDKCLAEHPLCVAASERKSADPEAKSTINRATSGLTRHILNTSSRLLNLRTVPRPRQAEPEPSPKQTPNTSDNESSDAETYAPGTNSNSSTSGAKLVRKDGGLDDSVFIAVKEIGRDLYRGLPTDERAQKLELMLDKLQQEIDQELEHNNTLLVEERDAPDARRKAAVGGALSKSGERLQALTLLTIHYRAGIEDLETTETAESAETGESPGDTPPAFTAEEYDSDTSSPVEVLHHVGPDRICGEASI
uniref:PDZ domain-containing protein 8 n=1 Tax=Knipowitschia caucasica TaxID=637954 RepID=A0AAV2JQD5_KNICA